MENIPFTRVSRGNRVKKKMQFKVVISLVKHAKHQNFSQLQQNYCQIFYDYLQALFKGAGSCKRLWSKMEQD